MTNMNGFMCSNYEIHIWEFHGENYYIVKMREGSKWAQYITVQAGLDRNLILKAPWHLRRMEGTPGQDLWISTDLIKLGWRRQMFSWLLYYQKVPKYRCQERYAMYTLVNPTLYSKSVDYIILFLLKTLVVCSR